MEFWKGMGCQAHNQLAKTMTSSFHILSLALLTSQDNCHIVTCLLERLTEHGHKATSSMRTKALSKYGLSPSELPTKAADPPQASPEMPIALADPLG